MGMFSLEHSKAAYRADFALYAGAIALLTGFLVADGPRAQWPRLVAAVTLGLLGWTLIEYVLHRFVLHGLQPFKRWHAEHHQRPVALICSPTLMSAGLIASLVFLPALLLANLLLACAVTLGVLMGYLAYATTHHATHHWRTSNAWLRQRKQWHALHHQHVDAAGYFGVTNGFWDRVFGSVRR